MNLFLYQPPGVGDICIPTPTLRAAYASSIKQPLENIYKAFLKQRSKPKLFPFQMSKSLWSNDSHTIMPKLLRKEEKTLLPSTADRCKKEKAWGKTPPHVEGTRTDSV